MKYRSEIDGLRAIAVVPVILFHARFDLFSGGFVGVDVFFVISGYLITTIIINEMENGTFTLLRFYERRARRILPSLFFVVLCCIPAAWFLLLPSDMKDFAQSVVAVATFSSNILFWIESGYFATEAELKPLLHTWSLAVEEQFYILFPLFLMAVWRSGLRAIVGLLILMFVVSLAVAHWGAYNNPSATFYLLPTRAWELLIGAFAAFYLQRTSVSFPYWLNNWLSAFGLAAILYSVFAFDEATPFPSLYALVPTAGTVLIILFSLRGTWTHTILSLKSVVGLGLISYSLYLWHQPVFAFWRHYNLLEPAYTQMLSAAFISFILAIVTYYVVEAPFRGKSAALNRRQIFSGSSVVLGALVALGLAGHLTTGFPQRNENVSIWENFLDNRRPKRSCTIGFEPTKLESCSFGPEGREVQVLAIGDSHIGQWSDILANIASDNQIHIEIIAKSACAIPEVEYFYKGIGRKYKECTIWRENLLSHIQESRPRLVLIQNSSLGYLKNGVSLSDWEVGLRKVFQKLEGINRVIWVLDNPRFPFDVRKCAARVLLQGYDESYCSIDREVGIHSDLRKVEIATVGEFPNVYVFDLTDFFCNSDVCFGVRSQHPLMSDTNHISQHSAEQLKDDLVDAIILE